MMSPILHYMVISINPIFLHEYKFDNLLYIDVVPTAETPWTDLLNRGVVVKNYLSMLIF